uniref:Uncharacterized protein n=1 Tax=viral metagenome TaxID=1070528 RepID=A0A6C0E3Z4_9ZZZZ
MTKFIKLTNYIININHIHRIVIKPNKYYIHLVSNKFDGFKWDVGVIGIGTIASHNSEIEVCETKHPIDYKILSEWIDNY